MLNLLNVSLMALKRSMSPITRHSSDLWVCASATSLARLRSKQRRLLSEGRAAMGVVTGHWSGSHGHKVVVYEFRLPGGELIKGRAASLKKPVGTLLNIIYDPDRPRRSAIYPLQLVRVDTEW